MRRGGSRIEISRSVEGADPPQICVGDVASDTGDLVDMASHEEVGTVDGCVAGTTKQVRVRLAVNRYPFVTLHLRQCRFASVSVST